MKKLISVLFICFCSMSGFSQTALHRKAERSFNRFEFAKAAHKYEKIVKRNLEDQDSWSRLVHCYKVLNYRATERARIARSLAPLKSKASEKVMRAM